MGRVIRFRGGAHREVQDLLPWRLAGQLDPIEQERVDAHLTVCAECQAEARFQARLTQEISATSLDVEHGWAAMRARIEAEAPPEPVRTPAPRAQKARRPRFFPSPGAGAVAIGGAPAWVGWALSGVLLVTLVIWISPFGPFAAYRTFADKPATAATGNVLVIFRPEAREQEVLKTLRAAHARLVDGPTAADAYVLAVQPAERDAAIAALRKRADVVLAQPIDPRGR